MSIDINEVLDNMDDLLKESRALPFTDKRLIDIEEMKELINDVRINIPQEIKRARLIDSDRERIIKSAEAQADKIISNAENKAKVLLSEQEILKDAKRNAEEILTKANKTSKEVRIALDNYVEKKLSDVEKELQTTLDTVKSTKNKYKSYKK